MTDPVYGPRSDWRTFTFHTENMTLKQFKAEWYKLMSEENIASDMIICFKNGDVKLTSSNIFWGGIQNPENYKYFIDGQAAGKVFSKIRSIDFMHSLRTHPKCAEFWKQDEHGVYRSFDFRGARPAIDRLLNELIASAPNDRQTVCVSLQEQIAGAQDRIIQQRSQFPTQSKDPAR